MDIVFLGTGASEGIPSIFCDCEVCKNAREKGGKENRSRMGMLINDDLLLDLSADMKNETIKAGVNLLGIKDILITHSHCDHLSVDDVIPHICFKRGGNNKEINLYSNKSVIERVDKALKWYIYDDIKLHTHFLEHGKKAKVGRYEVLPLSSLHMENEDCLYYMISDGEKKYLHLCDGGEFLDRTLKLIKEEVKGVDLVVYDMTFGLDKQEYFGHLNLEQVKKRKEQLLAMGAITEKTRNIVTHISHYAGTHYQIQQVAREYGIEVGFDGMKISI